MVAAMVSASSMALADQLTVTCPAGFQARAGGAPSGVHRSALDRAFARSRMALPDRRLSVRVASPPRPPRTGSAPEILAEFSNDAPATRRSSGRGHRPRSPSTRRQKAVGAFRSRGWCPGTRRGRRGSDPPPVCRTRDDRVPISASLDGSRHHRPPSSESSRSGTINVPSSSPFLPDLVGGHRACASRSAPSARCRRCRAAGGRRRRACPAWPARRSRPAPRSSRCGATTSWNSRAIRARSASLVLEERSGHGLLRGVALGPGPRRRRARPADRAQRSPRQGDGGPSGRVRIDHRERRVRSKGMTTSAAAGRVARPLVEADDQRRAPGRRGAPVGQLGARKAAGTIARRGHEWVPTCSKAGGSEPEGCRGPSQIREVGGEIVSPGKPISSIAQGQGAPNPACSPSSICQPPGKSGWRPRGWRCRPR